MADIKPKIAALMECDPSSGIESYEFMLIQGEIIELSYKSVRDRLIVTNKRLIIINIQGLIGKKKEYMVIPYSKISSFSGETAGTLDIDAELKIWCSGLGSIEFEFLRNTDIKPLVRILSEHICR
ncbi:PH domain-containing protein [Hathewaya histolytica]|uniref:PH domain-containing protein n=1 Tax=Hathewaya histolytica TaxID=1498 RepID=UPI003B67690E